MSVSPEHPDWEGAPQNADPDGEFVRDTNYINDRISPSVTDVTEQPDGTYLWPMEAGRYRLAAARACPWAHRAVIARRLLGLEDAISLALAGPTHDKRSWTFDLDPGEVDPVLGIKRLQDAYFNRYPDYPRGITVPALVEESSVRVVTNDFPSIVRDFITEWTDFHREGAPNLYPAEYAEEIDEINPYIFRAINNGVYRCGFAGSQDAYDEAYEELWEALDWVEERLGKQRYMVGPHITETDIRLFVTLIRFDPVYYSHFKCSRHKMAELPNIRGYLQELFQLPGFGDTTDFAEIKQHYFITHQEINPTQVVPIGPALDWLAQPHDRDRFGGTPFAEGTTLPGAIPAGEEVKNPLPFQR
ncbi:MAG: glutathione S-transferase C-terminal domain-containing protein [Corynebacterium camporealensis]|uniref:glutathione S-transferase family protein n=1 Tax=Corynebacterium camporealensis TaxID=161896 RepID=UPI002A917248|nr:glutathione S-transferase C-terminal domain-containing protein [Corynebacterium camporealensis]MDY5840180.1 glutathione S-transferase C-terminal domain-containing protein [Corynebacterium camporealensis]